jgi:DNA-binding transcriptional LysR family regulator
MHVELRLMRYVVAVADEGSFQAAARRLHMAQPPLSRQIAGLERELGVRLFERDPTRLTGAGQVFADAARRILAQTEQAIERTRQAAHRQSGLVRLGYTVTASYDTVPAVLDACHHQHPDLTIETREMWPPELIAALRSRRLDAAIGRGLPPDPGIARLRLRRERLVALVAAAHPLAGQPAVRLSDFRGATFRFFPRPRSPGYYDTIRAILDGSGEAFEIAENPTPGLRHLSLLDGHGFTLVPETVGTNPPGGTVVIPLADSLPLVELELLWRDDAPAPDATQPDATRPEAPAPAVSAMLSAARALAASRGWTS